MLAEKIKNAEDEAAAKMLEAEGLSFASKKRIERNAAETMKKEKVKWSLDNYTHHSVEQAVACVYSA